MCVHVSARVRRIFMRAHARAQAALKKNASGKIWHIPSALMRVHGAAHVQALGELAARGMHPGRQVSLLDGERHRGARRRGLSLWPAATAALGLSSEIVLSVWHRGCLLVASLRSGLRGPHA